MKVYKYPEKKEKILISTAVTESSLIGVAFLHSLVYFLDKFVILEPPARNGKKRGRRLRNESFDNDFRTNKFKEINYFINILKGLVEVKFFWMLNIFLSHFRSLN